VPQREILQALSLPRSAITQFVQRLEHETMIDCSPEDKGEPLPGALLSPFGLTRLLVLALWHDADLVGMQVCGYRQPRPLTRRQRRLAPGISQLASLALANARLLQELEAVNRFRDEFVSAMSHELRTPLHIILGYGEILREEIAGPLVDEQKRILKSIDRSAKELLGLVNATLDLSGLQHNSAALHVRKIDTARFLEELGTEAQLGNTKPHLAVEWSSTADIPPLYTDPEKLKLVLSNLLNNALKFTERGLVTLSAGQQGDGVEFLVTDTGMGIAPEVLPLIFEPFRQGDSSPTRQYGGAGLGLYIVRQLLEVLGGHVSVTSEAGIGSLFRVWVPEHVRTANDGG
jgi:signal transduction histidine kinase